MVSRKQDRASYVYAGALLLASGLMAPAHAQGSVGDVRVALHPPGTQVGVVTSTREDSAWIRLPHMTRVGVAVAFSTFSDSGDALARGQIQWVAPTAPYEAYVTGIKPVSTRHPLNPYDDLFAAGSLTGETVPHSTVPHSDGRGVSLATGFFVRAPLEPEPTDVDAEEPVRANLKALRSLKNKTAKDIVASAERALVADPLNAGADAMAEDAVNYAVLVDNLRRFRRMKIVDPITDRLLRRLFRLAEEHTHSSGSLPDDFLRPPAAPSSTGQPGTSPGTTGG